MSFIERIQKSWHLVKVSWHLLMQDKELLLFPIISTAAAIALFVGLVIPSLFGGENLGYLGFALWYFSAAFVTIFLNAALFACVKKRMHGGDPTIGYGLREATKRIVPILLWSLLTTTIGLVLRWLEQLAEDNFIAQIVISILGAAWSLMTMFVIPVLVVENIGVLSAIKRSASLFKKTWGENLVADLSIGLGFFLFYAVGVLALLLTWFLAPAAFFIPMLIIVALYIAIVAVFQATLSMVFDAVLYSYATGDNVPSAFKVTVEEAFKPKERR